MQKRAVDTCPDAYADTCDDAYTNGCVPIHVSIVDAKTGLISINIIDVPRNHVFATTPPSCECVRFFTERHKRYPLIVQ